MRVLLLGVVTVLTGILVVEAIAFLASSAWRLVLLGYGSRMVWIATWSLVTVTLVIGARAICRRRFRFGLRVVFVLVSLAGLLSWWLAAYLPERWQDQRVHRALAILKEHRPRLYGPQYRGQHYTAYFESANKLAFCDMDFSGVPLTDHDLADLAGCPGLIGLNLRGTQVSDSGMRCVAQFPKLVRIDVSATPVSATGIEQLRHLPTLSCLTVDANQLRQLANVADDALPQVSQLWLDNDSIDDQAISDLDRWGKLESLVILHARITDRGLAHLGRVTTLRHLHLEDCTGVTNAGLKHLSNLHRLEVLCIFDNSTTISGGAQLHELLPNCGIVVDQFLGRPYVRGPRQAEGQGRGSEWSNALSSSGYWIQKVTPHKPPRHDRGERWSKASETRALRRSVRVAATPVKGVSSDTAGEPDESVVQAGRQQLEAKNYTPIPVYSQRGRRGFIRLIHANLGDFGGGLVQADYVIDVRDAVLVFGDMEITTVVWGLKDDNVFFNVDKTGLVKVGDFELKKGECVLLSDGRFSKLDIVVTVE